MPNTPISHTIQGAPTGELPFVSMTFRQYLLTMLFGTALCWVSFGLVLFNVDPFHSNLAGFLFFYLSFFFALLGTSTVVWSLLASWRSDEGIPLFRLVGVRFWYSAMLSASLVLLLFLQSLRVLRPWNVALFLFCLFLLAVYRYTVNRSHT